MSLPRATLEAYRTLGVTRDAVAAQPQITPQLLAITLTIKRHGQLQTIRQRTIVHPDDSTERKATSEHVVDSYPLPYGPGSDLITAWPTYLSSSEDPDMLKLLALRREYPHAIARLLPIEAFCLAAGVSPLRVLEVLVGVIVRQGAQASTIIAAINHPRVVQKTVDMALTDEGIEDRNTLHKAVNFLPTPKGNTTIINNTPMANASASATAQAAAVAPPPEQTIRRLSDRFNEARLIASVPVAALPKAPPADPTLAAAAVPAARFGDPAPRYTVPSHITAPSEPSAPQEEEEDELL